MRKTYLAVSLALFCYTFYGMVIYQNWWDGVAASVTGMASLYFKKEEDNEDNNDDSVHTNDDLSA